MPMENESFAYFFLLSANGRLAMGVKKGKIIARPFQHKLTDKHPGAMPRWNSVESEQSGPWKTGRVKTSPAGKFGHYGLIRIVKPRGELCPNESTFDFYRHRKFRPDVIFHCQAPG